MHTKTINIQKYILSFFFLAYTFVVYPSKAVGLATGPSFGITGYYSSLHLKEQNSGTDSINNLALQMGWFTQLDFWLLYAKLDGLLLLDWHKLPNKSPRIFSNYIKVPLTIGMPVFSLLRPHIGLFFRIPLGGLSELNSNQLIEHYKEKINGYIVGMGLDLAPFLMDIDFEFGHSSIENKKINASLADGSYTPKQLGLKIHYNLLGSV